MYITERELRGQFEALEKTLALLMQSRDKARAQLDEVKKLVVLGCGSSYSLAKSAAMQFAQKTGRAAFALAAGDLLVNFGDYAKLLEGATLLLLSRSGATSELVRAASLCREGFGCRVLSVCARENAPVEELADWSLNIPWAFDEAVCQTRTVSNLYAAALGLACIAGGDEAGLEALTRLPALARDFCPRQEQSLTLAASEDWTRAVVLADSGCAGLAEEGALAFKEICRRDSNHYHMLDCRHGPMVQICPDTLVIALLSKGDRKLQAALLGDVAAKTSHLLVLDRADGGDKLPGRRIRLPDCGSADAEAIFGLYCIQLVCYRHALGRGVDPDSPEGLEPWIKL